MTDLLIRIKNVVNKHTNELEERVKRFINSETRWSLDCLEITIESDEIKKDCSTCRYRRSEDPICRFCNRDEDLSKKWKSRDDT